MSNHQNHAIKLMNSIARANNAADALAAIAHYREQITVETQDALARIVEGVALPGTATAIREGHLRAYRDAVIHAVRGWHT
jgi:hypothetical protein